MINKQICHSDPSPISDSSKYLEVQFKALIRSAWLLFDRDNTKSLTYQIKTDLQQKHSLFSLEYPLSVYSMSAKSYK